MFIACCYLLSPNNASLSPCFETVNEKRGLSQAPASGFCN